MTRIGVERKSSNRRKTDRRKSGKKIKEKASSLTETQRAADSLEGAYYGFIASGLSGENLENKTIKAVFLFMEEIDLVETVDETIDKIQDPTAKAAIKKAADKLLDRYEPTEQERLESSLVHARFMQGLLIIFIFLALGWAYVLA